ncbi:pimeloyl-ACP methyl ester carboxylesterase [Caballeronia udeis]|uniref:Pimeloyl-ACP methyl ester carboxylesterase n=1 Tax=Caballeronia udeis TaxID=1232866 RepID=A0ABW8MCQ4_9BURK
MKTIWIWVTLMLAVGSASALPPSGDAMNGLGSSDELPPPLVVHHERRWVNGVRIHFVTAGSGQPVLLIHGWPETWYAWRKVIPRLAGRYFVIAPDMRGMGDSSKPLEGYDKKSVATDLHELVRSLGFDRVLLVGHDMGGQVAYTYAAQWPQEVRKFAFIESGLPAFGQEASMDVAKGGSWHFGFNMQGDLAEALVRGRERLFLEYLFKRDRIGLVDPTAVSDADLEIYADAWRQPGALRASFAYYQQLLGQDTADNKRFGATKLPMPVLAIGAEYGYKDSAERTMQAVALNVQGAIISNSGHYIPEEQPLALVRLLLDFFANDVNRNAKKQGASQ